MCGSKARKMAGKKTYCNINLADVIGVLEVNMALDAVAPSVLWQICGVACVKYDIEVSSCTNMTWGLRGKADGMF